MKTAQRFIAGLHDAGRVRGFALLIVEESQ